MSFGLTRKNSRDLADLGRNDNHDSDHGVYSRDAIEQGDDYRARAQRPSFNLDWGHTARSRAEAERSGHVTRQLNWDMGMDDITDKVFGTRQYPQPITGTANYLDAGIIVGVVRKFLGK